MWQDVMLLFSYGAQQRSALRITLATLYVLSIKREQSCGHLDAQFDCNSASRPPFCNSAQFDRDSACFFRPQSCGPPAVALPESRVADSRGKDISACAGEDDEK